MLHPSSSCTTYHYDRAVCSHKTTPLAPSHPIDPVSPIYYIRIGLLSSLAPSGLDVGFHSHLTPGFSHLTRGFCSLQPACAASYIPYCSTRAIDINIIQGYCLQSLHPTPCFGFILLLWLRTNFERRTSFSFFFLFSNSNLGSRLGSHSLKRPFLTSACASLLLCSS